jgi:hypothetical protein
MTTTVKISLLEHKNPFRESGLLRLSVQVIDVKKVGQCLSFCDDRLVYDDYRDDITIGAFILSFSDDRIFYDDYCDDITIGALKNNPFRESGISDSLFGSLT